MSNRKATREIIARHRAQKLGLRNKKSSKILIKPKEHPKSVSLKKNVPTPKRLIPTQVFRNNFNPQLEQYIKNKSNFNFSIGIHDAGGGGDYLCWNPTSLFLRLREKTLLYARIEKTGR